MDSVPRFQQMAGLNDEIIANLTRAIEESFGKDVLASIVNETLASQLAIPTLMFHDELDPVTPVQDSLEIARAWPAAELIVTKGLGHRRALRNDEIIHKVVSFIGQNVEIKPAVNV
jgi:pimeloyl-ACP methyl ester carboxylesterase